MNLKLLIVEDTVWYFLSPKLSYDLIPATCGGAGSKNGLRIHFNSKQFLPTIPYRTLVEVPFFVTMTGSCNQFVNIELQILPTCEIPTESSYPYQYGGVYANGSYAIDYSNVVSTLTSVSSFSVSWKPSSALSASTSPDQINSTAAVPSPSLLYIMILVVQGLILLGIGVNIYFKLCVKKDVKNKMIQNDAQELNPMYNNEQNMDSQFSDKLISNNHVSLRSYHRKSSMSQLSDPQERNAPRITVGL